MFLIRVQAKPLIAGGDKRLDPVQVTSGGTVWTSLVHPEAKWTEIREVLGWSVGLCLEGDSPTCQIPVAVSLTYVVLDVVGFGGTGICIEIPVLQGLQVADDGL